MIKIQGLHKYFNKGKQNEIHVIDDVSLELPEKGMVAVFGKSGCGKTTLLNVLGGLDRYGSGSITLDGCDIRRNTDDLRNKYIGYIFQNYNLNKEESCFDNIADALRLCGMTDAAEIERRVDAALTNVDMQKYKLRTPDTLSGGQQQRIAIARAIVKNPKIILADEPTGNLDQSNTVMIMDLLKSISRDHLVILVTHEANLVDYYCDTVIELSDGKVSSIKNNTDTFGFTARDKNDIYLGELEKSDIKSESASIEYYGSAPGEPLKLRIVNNGGKLYLQINSPGVQILDEFSEVKLKEGVYEQKAQREHAEKKIDMSALPTVEGKRYGRLFGVKSSIKSGYVSNFKKHKKGKKVLRACMCLFAAVVVFMSAVFGTSFQKLIEAKEAYNHNVFYLYTPTADVSEKLLSQVGSSESGIDYISLLRSGNATSDAYMRFNLGSFESFETFYYISDYGTNAVFLDSTLAGDYRLLAGSRDSLDDQEMLISSAVADALIENSPFGYIEEYSDLIGLTSSNFSLGGKNFIIAGVVDSRESAVYLGEIAMARFVLENSSISVELGSGRGYEVKPGEAVFVKKNSDNGGKYPVVNETISIRGKSFKVTAIKQFYSDYYSWLKGNNIEKLDDYRYFCDILKDTTDYEEGTHEFNIMLNELINEKYYEYLDEYYYSEFDRFLVDYYAMDNSNFELWMYFEKGIEECKYIFAQNDYYLAQKYKEQNGRYPTMDEKIDISGGKDIYTVVEQYRRAYENEYSSQVKYQYSQSYNNLYLLSDNDYIALSKQIGDTHESAVNKYGNYYGGDIYYEQVYAVDKEIISSSSGTKPLSTGETAYTVIHSSDPKKTEMWLEGEFSDLSTGSPYRRAIVTPDTIFEQVVDNNKEMIISGIITMAVILLILSVCMYFIMRSSLMNRIKEVGIYRAIGVSKKNLIFRFLVEAAVLMALTVFIGYLGTSVFIYATFSISTLASQLLFYPVWMALAVLAVLGGLCLFCGTLPIISLLRKTPSEILAKYDI